MLFVRTAFLNVMRNWHHSLSALAMIALCFSAMSLVAGFLSKATEEYYDVFAKRSMLGSFLVQKSGADQHYAQDPQKYGISKTEQAQIDKFLQERKNAVYGTVRFLELSGLLTSGSTTTLMAGYGYDVDEGVKMRGEAWAVNTLLGKPLHESSPSSVVVGATLGRILECQDNGGFSCTRQEVQLSSTTLSGQVNASYLKIGGVLEPGFREIDDKFVAMPLRDAQRLLDTDTVSMYSVLASENFEAELRAFLQTITGELQVRKWQDHPIGALYVRGMGLLNAFRWITTTVVIAVCGLTVGNSMLRRVQERIREIGTLRSMGFSRRRVRAFFLIEAAILSIIGSAVGALFSLICASLIGMANIQYNPGFLSGTTQLLVVISPLDGLVSCALILAASMGATWICAARSTSLNIADALQAI